MPPPLHPPARGVVAIGASAGGIDALRHVVAGIPPDLPACVCIVLHIPASPRSVLADIIARSTSLPVEVAAHQAILRAGTVYVAPPDHHLLVEAGRTLLDRGPKENATRPAIDPLLRTTAAAYGRRAMGIVLSGALGDGAAGLAQLAAAGGAAMVQDPREALVPSMPETALAATPTATTCSARDMGAAIAAFARDLPLQPIEEVEVSEHPEAAPVERSRRRPEGPPTGYTCPECHGPLWELGQDRPARFRCRVGHAYYEDALVSAKSDEIEAALWAALEALEERAELMERIALRLERDAAPARAARYREREADALAKAEQLRAMLVAGGEAEAVAAR